MGGGKTTNLSNILVYEEQEIHHIETSGDAILVTVRPFRLDQPTSLFAFDFLGTRSKQRPSKGSRFVDGLRLDNALRNISRTDEAIV